MNASGLFLVPKSEQTRSLCAASAQPAYSPSPQPSPALPTRALPLQWLLNPSKAKFLTDRILARLIFAEAHEPNAHLKDDYRQSQVCVILAEKGSPIPFMESSYICYGLHPAKVWSAILRNREAWLGTKTEALCSEKLTDSFAIGGSATSTKPAPITTTTLFTDRPNSPTSASMAPSEKLTHTSRIAPMPAKDSAASALAGRSVSAPNIPQKGANAIPEATVGFPQVRDSSMSGMVTGPGEARRESDGTGVGPIALPSPRNPVQKERAA